MPIIVNLDVMLANRKMRLNTLAELVGITPQNLSILKTGRAKAIRFSTLERICEVLRCGPGELLAYETPRADRMTPIPQDFGPESSPEIVECEFATSEALNI